MFMTGVGEVFPFIRSHTVLNNLAKRCQDAAHCDVLSPVIFHTPLKKVHLSIYLANFETTSTTAHSTCTNERLKVNLRSIFEFPIDRPIEGVIKADDEAGLKTEIEEYVLTDEIERRFDDFLEAYNQYKEVQWCLDLWVVWLWQVSHAQNAFVDAAGQRSCGPQGRRSIPQ